MNFYLKVWFHTISVIGFPKAGTFVCNSYSISQLPSLVMNWHLTVWWLLIGTSFLLMLLGMQPEITMPPNEFCGIKGRNGDRELIQWMKNQSRYNPPSQKYGIKCPSMVRDTDMIENLIKVSVYTRLVIGVRHPVLWFQSFYNHRWVDVHYPALASKWRMTNLRIPCLFYSICRVWENYHFPELYKDSPIQSPFDLNNTHHWRDVTPVYSKFDIFMKQLAKVSLTSDEMYEVFHSGDEIWPKRFSVNPFKVFIYTIEQLSDKNATRQSIFRDDLKEFLRLDQQLPDFNSFPKANQHHQNYPEYIDMCEQKNSAIRNSLLASGKKSSDWILHKFIKSSDVTVSNVEHFRQNLESWGIDPCAWCGEDLSLLLCCNPTTSSLLTEKVEVGSSSCLSSVMCNRAWGFKRLYVLRNVLLPHSKIANS